MLRDLEVLLRLLWGGDHRCRAEGIQPLEAGALHSGKFLLEKRVVVVPRSGCPASGDEEMCGNRPVGGGVLLGPPWASVQDVGLAMHVTLCVVLSYTGISPRIEQGVPARGSFVPRGQRAMSGGIGEGVGFNGTWQVEAGGAARRPAVSREAPQQRMIWLPKLRKPGVGTLSLSVPAVVGGDLGWVHAAPMLPVSVLSLQNPDIVLVHYLNVPAIEDCGKPCGPILCSINTDKKEWAKWTKEELIGQLKPMCE